MNKIEKGAGGVLVWLEADINMDTTSPTRSSDWLPRAAPGTAHSGKD